VFICDSSGHLLIFNYVTDDRQGRVADDETFVSAWRDKYKLRLFLLYRILNLSRLALVRKMSAALACPWPHPAHQSSRSIAFLFLEAWRRGGAKGLGHVSFLPFFSSPLLFHAYLWSIAFFFSIINLSTKEKRRGREEKKRKETKPRRQNAWPR